MTIKTFFQLLRRHFLLLLAAGLVTAGAAYYLVSKQKQEYTSKALVSTGIISSVSIKNTQGGKSADRDYAQNELENLVSLATAHKTREELSTRLLARYLTLDQADRRYISQAEFDFLHEEVFTASIWQLKDTSFARTLANVTAARDAAEGNDVQALIYSDEGYFGIDYLAEHLKVYRRGNSDLLEFIYSTTDAAFCRQTLNEMLDLFMEKHTKLKKSQSSEVSDFFAEATQNSNSRLKDAEARLLQFRVQNNIINYNEQTRTIAIQKEDLDAVRFEEDMKLQGIQATRQRVEQELGNRSALSDINQGLLSLKEELNQVAQQLSNEEIASADPTADNSLTVARRAELEARRSELQQQMAKFTQQRFDFEQSPNGINTQKLLDEWLATIITEEQASARLSVIGKRQNDFANIYSQYAPWGSRLKELQREIELAEDEYLTNLHSYNQAMLHQQHTLMSTNLEVIDSPYLPISKPDFKQLLLVVLGFIGGSGMVFAALLTFAFLDETLRTPDRVLEKVGMEVATVLPDMKDIDSKSATVQQRHESALHQALALLLQQIKVETLQKDAQPRLVLVTSTRQQEGKTWMATQAANYLRAEDNRVLYLHPTESGMLPAQNEPDSLGYEMSSRMLDAETVDQLDIFGEVEPFLEMYHYVIVEIPALLTGKYPLGLLRQFDLSLLVCCANRSWEEADRQALNTLQRATRSPIRTILNGVDMATMEVFMGELMQPQMAPVLTSRPKRQPYQYDK
ncbi:MAG: hypothetical protein AAGJ82_06570 [Bacteroidota bacterium]